MAEERLVVDGMNVIGARPDGWWRDRDGAVRRLHARLRGLGGSVVLVLDGRPLPDLPEGVHGGVTVRYGRRRGPDAADDRIVELVAEDSEITVVTSDRRLRERVRALGAEIRGAGAFLRGLDGGSGAVRDEEGPD